MNVDRANTPSELVASADRSSLSATDLARLSPSVSTLEIRADLIGDISVPWLRQHFGGTLVYSLGPKSSLSDAERRNRLLQASAEYDIVDFDASADLPFVKELNLPTHRSWLSAREVESSGFAKTFEGLSAKPASLYRLIGSRYSTEDGIDYNSLAPLRWLSKLRRSNVVAYTDGNAMAWTRAVALQLGAPALFGCVTSSTRTEEACTIANLIQQYALPRRLSRELYGIVLKSTGTRSPSPSLHNRAYQRLGYGGLYVPLACNDLRQLLQTLHGIPDLELRGLTVAAPHKNVAFEIATHTSPICRSAQASNLLRRVGHGWRAESSDPQGVLAAVHRCGLRMEGLDAVVIGCGGSGRTIAAALKRAGAHCVLANRSVNVGKQWAARLGCDFVALGDLRLDGVQLLVHATPLGSRGEPFPVDLSTLDPNALVIELCYGAQPTQLVHEGLTKGLRVIDGHQVLRSQVALQFEGMHDMAFPDAAWMDADPLVSLDTSPITDHDSGHDSNDDQTRCLEVPA